MTLLDKLYLYYKRKKLSWLNGEHKKLQLELERFMKYGKKQ